MICEPISPLRALVLASSLLLAACGSSGGGHNSSAGIREPDPSPGLPESLTLTPDDTGDGWTVSSPGAEGMDPDALLAGLTTIRDGTYPGVDGAVIVRHGRLVAEGYFNGFGRQSLHDLRSTGKSFTSALAGIAIDQGLMSLDEPISQIIPQFNNYARMDDRKRAITVFNLLNMNSGLDCNDSVPASPGNESRMYPTQDWVGFILDLPMAGPPGAGAAYCTGGVIVLGHIISLRSGMTLDSYAAANLFAPLGIRQSDWLRSPDGRATGGGGLKLAPRDMAKFGAMYLNGGVWNGTQVVPAQWVAQSQRRVETLGRDNDGYGFLWWKRSFTHEGQAVESFFTSGNGGNFIFVVPALELVAAFTGSNYGSSLSNQPFDILANRILPAISE